MSKNKFDIRKDMVSVTNYIEKLQAGLNAHEFGEVRLLMDKKERYK